MQKDNPLTEELKQQILQIDGITDVETYTGTFVTSDAFDGEREWLAGVPESGKEQLEAGIIEGNTTYEELKSGDKVIVDKNLLYWWPNLQIGDVLDVTVEDGDGTHERKLEIAAIGQYPLSFTNYSYLIMAQEGLFYTLGTLFIAVGGGSLAGYPVFLWAKDNSIFNISNYHYPVQAAIVVAMVLLSVQFVLTLILQKATKKESLIDRIRFTN